MNVIFYTNLTLPDLIKHMSFRRNKGIIFYFNATVFAQVLIEKVGIFGIVKRFDFELPELRDPIEGHLIPRVFGRDVVDLCDLVESDFLVHSKFISVWGSHFCDPKKAVYYFRKCSIPEIEQQSVYLNVINWYKNAHIYNNCEYVLYIDGANFPNQLRDFALMRYSIHVKNKWSLKKFLRDLVKLLFSLFSIFKSVVAAFLTQFGKKKTQAPIPSMSGTFTLRGFSFDPSRRSDFPWLLTDILKDQRVLLCFDRRDVKVTGAMAEELRDRGIVPIAMSPKAAGDASIPVFRTGWINLFVQTRNCLWIFWCSLYALITFKPVSVQLISWAFSFVNEYSFFSDFYGKNNIKVDLDFVDHDPLRVARRMALEKCGGVSISYQVSNWPIPNPILGSCADVKFLFGPYYLQRYIKSGHLSRTIVFHGYINDYSFPYIKEGATALREKLSASGAKFVISFFDENSSDQNRIDVIPNSRSEKIYSAFFRFILDDPTVGIIFSPKRPRTLTSRLPGIIELKKRAEATGRCYFIDGEYSTDLLPAQISKAADITVTLLSGGTTALECYLAGSKVVFLDLEGFKEYEEYFYGKDKIVFDNIDVLVNCLKNIMGAPDLDIGSVEYIKNIDQKDPFRDSRSAERMAHYISNLLNKAKTAPYRDAMITFADREYALTWGEKNIPVHMTNNREDKK